MKHRLRVILNNDREYIHGDVTKEELHNLIDRYIRRHPEGFTIDIDPPTGRQKSKKYYKSWSQP